MSRLRGDPGNVERFLGGGGSTYLGGNCSFDVHSQSLHVRPSFAGFTPVSSKLGGSCPDVPPSGRPRNCEAVSRWWRQYF
jgi:hypothetical protein